MYRTHDDILLGRRQRVLECASGVRLIQATYAPGTRFPPHAHDRGNVSLIVRGQIEEIVGRDAVGAATCDVVVKPAGTVHGNRFGPDGARTLVVEIPTSFRALGRWRWFHGGPATASALRVYRAISQSDEVVDLDELVAEFIAVIEDELNVPPAPTAPPWVRRVRDVIHDSFPHPVSVAQLARSVDVHPVYLARAFRARFGCAVTQYVRRLRVRAAAHRLACSSAPVCDVALAMGFADQAHLTRVFKRDTGVTPARFRRLTQAN